MRTIDLALKDLRQVLRDRRSLVFLLVMPIVFTLFFGFVFNNQAKQADSRLIVAVVNQDPQGVLSSALVNLLNASTTVRVEAVSLADAAQIDSRILKGELAAGLTIPAGFSAGTLNGEAPKMDLVINEESPDGQTARRGLQSGITRALGIAQGARSSLAAYEAQAGSLSPAERSAYLQDAVARAAKEWQDAPLSIQVTSKTIELDPLSANPFNQFSPGMMIMFAIFGLMQSALVMVMERRNGAMARLLTTPMNRAELIGGHILGTFLVLFVQQLLLVLFGQFALKVDYFRQPVATLLMMAVLSLWVASLGLLISTLSKKEDQVVLFSMVAMFLFSALGGSWFSLEMVGKTFATIGHLTPTAWAIDGFQNIIARGQGLNSVLLPAGIVLAYAAAFFGIAIWKFKFE